ncbi:RipA family octameric membrane protein [Pseudobutyrivibrio ruminis]|uniref:RipA family octameric membrane protein n=1 Tax=Pseudobutyrivibrio ruminis TaxID=46206 RepID=UPI00068C6CE7|nr:hypothetical protein [Pseudobutyrivibrio ruminis]
MTLFNDIDNTNTELFEIYKMYVETAERVSEKRGNTNNFFLAINMAVVTVININGFDCSNYWWAISFAGISISVLWFASINSYKQLNSGKYKVIEELEGKLSANVFSYEWEILGRGKDKTKYCKVSKLEKIIPCLFGIIYIVFAIANLYCLCT